jgi:hypothetical protein
MWMGTQVFKCGDLVEMQHAGKRMPAQVAYASDNGKALMLLFSGMFIGYVGWMPLFSEDGEVFTDLIQHHQVLLRRRSEQVH